MYTVIVLLLVCFFNGGSMLWTVLVHMLETVRFWRGSCGQLLGSVNRYVKAIVRSFSGRGIEMESG